MTKKNFKGGLDSLLGDVKIQEAKETAPQGRPKRGRPKQELKQITKSSQEGTKVNETRATFIVNEEILDKLKAVAYWERILIKEVINTALQGYLEKYEKENGDIKPIKK
jgi:hypothetical protein